MVQWQVPSIKSDRFKSRNQPLQYYESKAVYHDLSQTLPNVGVLRTTFSFVLIIGFL